jgi:two-component system sensor histidine kinase PhoQ
MRLHSLRARVVLWVSVALIVLFAVTIVGLDRVFDASTRSALDELLQNQLDGLIAVAEPDASGELSLPKDLINPQFEAARSGQYGVLWNANEEPVWESLSLLRHHLILPELPAPGEHRRFRIVVPDLGPLEVLVMGVTWDFGGGRSAPYTFGVGVSLQPYQQRQTSFRRRLIGWFAGLTLTMLLVTAGLLSWVLRPLRSLEKQVREVESGTRASLTGSFPSELTGLAQNLNAFISSERSRLVRYRNTLDDLAHSLKTPLAAMHTLLAERSAATQTDALRRELDRMDQRVSYQLKRARASGATGIGVEPVRVAPVVEDLKATLDKVYRDKGVDCRVSVAPGAVFRGDAGDLTEILGNLLDNAYKYCAGRVEVEATQTDGRLSIRVADDGPGIEPDAVQTLLERGRRADESVPGQGIGLAVVRETVELYHGRLSLGRSAAGGVEATVELARVGGVR